MPATSAGMTSRESGVFVFPSALLGILRLPIGPWCLWKHDVAPSREIQHQSDRRRTDLGQPRRATERNKRDRGVHIDDAYHRHHEKIHQELGGCSPFGIV